MKCDGIIYLIEFIFWVIYVIIKVISKSDQVIQTSLGGINIFLCMVYAITFSWWAGRLSQRPTNNNINNAGVVINNAGAEFPP
ncbi:hypothetical protein C1645_775316 [Glomus cerebriforme]|uniref:Uncharacterized protein n=1 Tax=Glomus cerebriforme TaxID=658196 RepID=A0A397SQJ6_9GLOM|nr:hypothetical protein C1645_775316 [Glomus cerebriforme]